MGEELKERINAVVLFGYTKNQQNKGKVPGLEQEKLLVVCNKGDQVCNGTLTITVAHLTYSRELRITVVRTGLTRRVENITHAVDFIKSRVGEL